jgi:hypothetical protein
MQPALRKAGASRSRATHLETSSKFLQENFHIQRFSSYKKIQRND